MWLGRIKFHEAAALAAYRVGKLCSTILFSMVIVYYPLMSLVVLDCCISYWNLNVFSLLTYVLSFLRSIKLCSCFHTGTWRRHWHLDGGFVWPSTCWRTTWEIMHIIRYLYYSTRWIFTKDPLFSSVELHCYLNIHNSEVFF